MSYIPPAFLVPSLELDVELRAPIVRVRSRLSFERCKNGDTNLELDGEDLKLNAIGLDGRPVEASRFRLRSGGISLIDVPDRGILAFETELSTDAPSTRGLFQLGNSLVTHCEPEGFRRITFFPDRPDIRTKIRCRIVGDRDQYPVILSNGRLIERGFLSGNRHYAIWDDVRPKASYLFALVAGRFSVLNDSFITKSGRLIELNIYADSGDLPYCEKGVHWLKRAMRWDEDTYGLEYGLDSFTVVVMRDYPGGAMEYPGLNLHGASFFLSHPSISTDEQMRAVMASIAHEYFHEWTGNRIGIRSWSELSLKESLTVLRQQQFIASQVGAEEARIDDVAKLRKIQFLEDDGKFAHAIRPKQIECANSLFTRTIYDKGAEVLRMIETLVGAKTFRNAISAFLLEFDGRSVALSDFLAAIEARSGVDLTQFEQWFSEVGSYHVVIHHHFDPKNGLCTITLDQAIRGTDGTDTSRALHTPLAFGLIGGDGNSLTFRIENDREARSSGLFQLRHGREEIRLSGLVDRPTPSLFRNYSAPGRFHHDLSLDDIVNLALFDKDSFNRWDAAQTLARRAILELATESELGASSTWTRLFGQKLLCGVQDPGEVSRALVLPSEDDVGRECNPIPVESISRARRLLNRRVSVLYRHELIDIYRELTDPGADASNVSTRRMRNLCLALLSFDETGSGVELCRQQLFKTNNMTDALAALQPLIDLGGAERERALAWTLDKWRSVPAKLDHWCSAQAKSVAGDAPELLDRLLGTPLLALQDATRVRAVFDEFVVNRSALHRADGRGYSILTETIGVLMRSNVGLAARLLKAFGSWRSFDAKRQGLMRSCIQSIQNLPGLPLEFKTLVRDLELT